jgi:hypothetical protein
MNGAGKLLEALRLRGRDDVVFLCGEVKVGQKRASLPVHQAVTKFAVDQSSADQPLERRL